MRSHTSLLRLVPGLLLGVLFALPLLEARAEPVVRVQAAGRVTTVPLEEYVARVVSREVYPDWPEESLKAQAVIARTYALHERERRQGEGFDVDGSVLSQAYGSGRVPAPASRAADSTRGLYLAWDEGPILAAFHAAAGGRTASAHEVWGRPVPYLRSVPSPDDAAPDYFWSYELPWIDLVAALEGAGLAVDPAGGIEVAERSESGRVRQLRVGGAVLAGRDLRGLLGGRALRSALFEVSREGDLVRFVGSGAGHGVGLSQWGARELALQHKSFREILAHYYPGTALRRLNQGTP